MECVRSAQVHYARGKQRPVDTGHAREKIKERRWERKNGWVLLDFCILLTLTRPFHMKFTLIRLVQDLQVMMKRSLR